MISGNCNRSPQYTTMGPIQQHNMIFNSRYPLVNQTHHHQQHQPHVLFMAGGSVRGIPQVSRGFSTMSNVAPVHPIAVQCNMSQNFGIGHAYAPNSSPHHHIFQQQQHHYYHQQPMEQQPQLFHHHRSHQQHPLHPPQQQKQPHPLPQQQQQQPHHFNHQSYLTPPPPSPLMANTTPTSGFINGIKNMVKGIIQPLNCDFYSDHHKHYNPKFRNNYTRDITSDIDMSYFPQPHEPHLQIINSGLNCKTTITPPSTAKAQIVTNRPSKPDAPNPNYITGVMAIFTSEDFPELPAPRRSRSTTPAKTEKPTEQVARMQKAATPPKQPSLMSTPSTETMKKSQTVKSSQSSAIEPSPVPAMPLLSPPCPLRKSIFFEICNTNKPTGRRPTFGGRMKIVPPPFTLNKCVSPATDTTPRTSQESSAKSSSSDGDSDADDNSFVMLPNKAMEDCLTSICFNRPPRQRNLSECSDDSFVVFYAEDADTEIDFADDDEDEEDTSSEEDETDDDDDDYDTEDDGDFDTDSESELENGDKRIETGTDVVDCCPGMIKPNETDRIKCPAATTGLLYTDFNCPRGEHVQFDSGFDEKKVTFNEQPEVHVMHTWNYAYRAARKGHWEDVARDRSRFQKRIERTAAHINPILTPEHREKIYRTRFAAPTINADDDDDDNHLVEARSQTTTVDCSHDNNQTKVDETTLPVLDKI